MTPGIRDFKGGALPKNATFPVCHRSFSRIRPAGFWFVLCCLLLVVLVPAWAEPGPGKAGSSLLDFVSKKLEALGEKTREWLPAPVTPLSGLDITGPVGKTTVPWDFEKACPIRAGDTVCVQHEFGKIVVDTWDNAIVRIKAHVTISAETFETAYRVADAVTLSVVRQDSVVQVQVHYPDTRDLGQVTREADLHITIPANVQLACSNNFGDTCIQDIRGPVSVDSRFGKVQLTNITGAVTVRARGEYPLEASRLQQGGSFYLIGTRAAFSAIGGAVHINSFLGSVSLRELADTISVKAVCDSSPITLVLPGKSEPYLEMTAKFGQIQAPFSLSREEKGHTVIARRGTPGARAR